MLEVGGEAGERLEGKHEVSSRKHEAPGVVPEGGVRKGVCGGLGSLVCLAVIDRVRCGEALMSAPR